MQGSIFTFKHFSISQSLCAMKVGTDGVLIGAWADSDNRDTILDIGYWFWYRLNQSDARPTFPAIFGNRCRD